MQNLWELLCNGMMRLQLNSNVNNLRVTDFSTNGNPQKDYSYIGSITLN